MNWKNPYALHSTTMRMAVTAGFIATAEDRAHCLLHPELKKCEHPDLPGKALALAERVHANQFRKFYEPQRIPYIYHPLRVAIRTAEYMLRARKQNGYITGLPAGFVSSVCVALLHDVIEDAEYPAEVTQEISDMFGLNSSVLWGVQQLTGRSKREASDAPRAERKKMDREAYAELPSLYQTIKLLDRSDNLLDIPSGAKRDFVYLYAQESILLVEALTEADAETRGYVRAQAERLLVEYAPVES